MPVEWISPDKAPVDSGAFSCATTPDAPPLARVILRPSRSLPRRGFAWFLLIIWGLLLVPLVPLLGSVVLWVMLPFLLAVLAALWWSLERNYRDGELYEEMTLWRDLIRVDRHNPHRPSQHWQANPYWTTLHLRPEGGPVEEYLTLKGAGREIELGAFLSPEERVILYDAIARQLGKARTSVE